MIFTANCKLSLYNELGPETIEYAPTDDHNIRIQHTHEYPRHDVKVMYETSTSPTKVKHTKYQIRYQSVRTILHPVRLVPVPSLKVICYLQVQILELKIAEGVLRFGARALHCRL